MNGIAVGNGRSSSIELLRIVAMFAIVACHVSVAIMQVPMVSGGGYPSALDLSYRLDFSAASADPALWVLVLLETLGQWGNTVFVICTAWFLCRSGRMRFNKVVKMILDVFVVSVVILAIAVLVGLRPGFKDVVKCFFPTIFANNWFITCYLMLYALHPALNRLLGMLGKRGHAALTIVLACLYMLLPAVRDGLLCKTPFLVMLTLYVVVAFGRHHLPETLASAKLNRDMFLVGTLGAVTLIVLLEVLGLRVPAIAGKMLHFCKFGDPLVFLSAFGLFNLLRARSFSSARINRVAGLMLLVYLIHENYILRSYVRPWGWVWICDTLGYDLLFAWLFLFTVGLFGASLLCAWLYIKTLGRAVDCVEPSVKRVVQKVSSIVLDRVCALG